MRHAMNEAARRTGARSPLSRPLTGFVGVLAVAALAGCDSLLDVDNPNQLVQDDLESPAAAGALVNGALSTVARAFGYMMLRHDAASDELQFVGSRDAWVQLQIGDLRDPHNEFTDAAWPFVSEGRWMADEAIRQLGIFRDEGLLEQPLHLARAKLYSAMIYTQVADLWEDFVVSNRIEAAPPFGPDNMIQMYDRAIERLNLALPIAQAAGNQSLETAILAQRARTRHARAVWQKLNPPGSVPSDPLVHDAEMIQDATAALARMPDSNWRFTFQYSSGTISNNWGDWVNERQELRPSNAYGIPSESGLSLAEVTLEDPIDGIPDPALVDRVAEITENRQFGPVTVVSARELHLMLAEAALAQNDQAGFTAHINDLRALDGLTPYEGQIDALELLVHSRRTNLFNQGRRLNDHYRFGQPSFLWSQSHEAFQRPGTRFPITAIERDSNCFLLGTC